MQRDVWQGKTFLVEVVDTRTVEVPVLVHQHALDGVCAKCERIICVVSDKQPQRTVGVVAPVTDFNSAVVVPRLCLPGYGEEECVAPFPTLGRQCLEGMVTLRGMTGCCQQNDCRQQDGLFQCECQAGHVIEGWRCF